MRTALRSASLLAPLLWGCSDYEVQQLDVVDLFAQGGEDQHSDILFVVDDSASMAEEQQRLAGSFSTFTRILESTSVDFNLGVITTSSPALRGGVLLPEDEDLTEAFLSAVAVGSDGERIEEGFAQALAALSADSDFRRTGADVHLLFVSDEDDQSTGEVEQWRDQLTQAAAPDGLTVHALVGNLPSGCVAGPTAADAGERYLQAAALTDGRIGSICAEDYTAFLEQVGLTVAAWNDTFLLSKLPEPDTLEVRVDDVLMPERDEDGWTWSAGDNAIVFHGHAIPRPGMEIQVVYRVDVGELEEGGQDSG